MQIDLPPGKYRWRRPLSLPLAWTYVALGAVMLGWLFWYRDQMTTWHLFSGTAFIAACVGGLLANIFKDID